MSPQAILARRNARTIAGIVGVAGAATSVLVGTVEALSNWRPLGLALVTLLGTWPLMALVYWIVRTRHAPKPQDEATRFRMLRESESPSLFWPMAAVSVLAPLSIHFLVWLLGYNSLHYLLEFDYWILISAVIVGHAHAMLVVLCHNFAKDATGPLANRRLGLRDGLDAAAVVTLVATIPGAIVILPPVLVAVTGLLFIPLLFWYMNGLLWSERDLIPKQERVKEDLADDAAFHALESNILSNDSACSSARAGMLRALSASFRSERIKPVIDRCLWLPEDEITLTAIELCFDHRYRAPLDAVVHVATSAETTTAVRAVELLGRLGASEARSGRRPRSQQVGSASSSGFDGIRQKTETGEHGARVYVADAQTTLTTLLRTSRVLAIRQAAIKALGYVGDASAVEALKSARKPFNNRLKRAINSAIKRVQDRIGPDTGRLSLIQDPANKGALSTCSTKEGALSPTETDARSASHGTDSPQERVA